MSVRIDLNTKDASWVDANETQTRIRNRVRRCLSGICDWLTLGDFWYRAGRLYRYNMNAVRVLDCDSRAAWRIRRLTDEEIAQTTTWNVSQKLIQHRRVAGDICYGVVMGGEVVYLHWLTQNPCFIRGAILLVGLGSKDRYYYNVIVKPGFRGQGIGRTAQQQFLVLAANEGIERLISYIESENRCAQHVFQLLGYEILTKVWSYRMMGIRYGNYYNADSGALIRRFMNRCEQQYYWI